MIYFHCAPKMAVVGVSKLLLCCDICKRSIGHLLLHFAIGTKVGVPNIPGGCGRADSGMMGKVACNTHPEVWSPPIDFLPLERGLPH